MNSHKAENDSCFHLTSKENEEIFKNIQDRSLSTVIAEVFETNTHKDWKRIGCGALCFEKDNIKRSYFFRHYCLKRGQKIWEQEIYRKIEIFKEKSFLLTFEGDVSFSFWMTVKFKKILS
jgi:neural Wiskott-Aldrich syndrome protein